MTHQDPSPYRAVTRNIQVTVSPSFLDEQSDPRAGRYVWAYEIEIANLGRETVQLLSRHWRIVASDGDLQEVRGPGVVGEQPVLGPGQSFRYASGAPLATPSGFMSGTYEMRTSDGEIFSVEIPAFSLDSPNAPRVTH